MLRDLRDMDYYIKIFAPFGNVVSFFYTSICDFHNLRTTVWPNIGTKEFYCYFSALKCQL